MRPLRSLRVFLVTTVLLLSACSRAPSLADIFIKDEPQGLSQKTQSDILKAQDAVEKAPESTKSAFLLAHLYLQGVRENADTAFYDRIEKLMERVETVDPQNPEVPLLRGSVLMGRHHFAEALPYGKQITFSHPSVARYYGLLADAQVELGMYEEAEQTLQSMADINPDYNALTRIAYLREIRGDREGAIEAMETAVNQGTTVPENTAWGLAELGRLHLGSDLKTAAFSYDQSLAFYPDFPPALAGKATVLMLQGKTAEAQAIAEKAASLLPLPQYYTLVADIAGKDGNTPKRDTYLTLVGVGYDSLAKGGTKVESERARFLLDHDLQLPEALQLAKNSYAERNTIYTADTLAWALLKNGKASEATQYVTQALRTGTDDPFILFHAGLVAQANGDKAKAKEYLTKVVKTQPTFSFLFADEAKQALAAVSK